LKKLRRWFNKYLEDLLIVAGFVLILVGVYYAYPLAAWFTGGLECLIMGFLIAASKRK
jgi:hypothetical protein